jgi:hypothetical protein
MRLAAQQQSATAREAEEHDAEHDDAGDAAAGLRGGRTCRWRRGGDRRLHRRRLRRRRRQRFERREPSHVSRRRFAHAPARSTVLGRGRRRIAVHLRAKLAHAPRSPIRPVRQHLRNESGVEDCVTAMPQAPHDTRKARILRCEPSGTGGGALGGPRARPSSGPDGPPPGRAAHLPLLTDGPASGIVRRGPRPQQELPATRDERAKLSA